MAAINSGAVRITSNTKPVRGRLTYPRGTYIRPEKNAFRATAAAGVLGGPSGGGPGKPRFDEENPFLTTNTNLLNGPLGVRFNFNNALSPGTLPGVLHPGAYDVPLPPGYVTPDLSGLDTELGIASSPYYEPIVTPTLGGRPTGRIGGRAYGFVANEEENLIGDAEGGGGFGFGYGGGRRGGGGYGPARTAYDKSLVSQVLNWRVATG